MSKSQKQILSITKICIFSVFEIQNFFFEFSTHSPFGGASAVPSFWPSSHSSRRLSGSSPKIGVRPAMSTQNFCRHSSPNAVRRSRPPKGKHKIRFEIAETPKKAHQNQIVCSNSKITGFSLRGNSTSKRKVSNVFEGDDCHFASQSVWLFQPLVVSRMNTRFW